jgi:hypothetical protein
MLQRGRGAGLEAALRRGDVGDLVLDVVCRDPRWDNQTEERAGYLAYLVATLELPLDPVADHLLGRGNTDASSWRNDLALEVLGLLAARGRGDADALLYRCAVEGMDDAADVLAGAPPPILGPPPSPPPDLTDVPAAVLVDCARRRDWDAAAELARRVDPVLLELAEENFALEAAGAGPVRPYPNVLRVLRQLPVDLVLPAARRWAAHHPGDWADWYLLEHGSIEDAALLTVSWYRHLDDRDWSRVADYPLGLARLGVRSVVPSLLDAWHETPYAYGRTRLLGALAELAPEAARPLLREARNDCEAPARRLARN